MDTRVSRASLFVAAAISLICIAGCGEHSIGTAVPTPTVSGPLPTAVRTATPSGATPPASPIRTPSLQRTPTLTSTATPTQRFLPTATVTWTASPGPLPTATPFADATPTASPNGVPATRTVVFTCNVAITPDADGDLDYTFSGVFFSDQNGARVVDAGDQDGRICIAGSAPCAAPRPAPSGPGLWIPDQSVPSGSATATITVLLVTSGGWIAGIQADFTSPSTAPVVTKANGKPDCTLNPALDKSGTSFAFRPSGCSGTECTAVRALVLATDNTDPIGGGPSPAGDGAGCEVGFQCESAYCIDGICCATAACPAGEFCDIPSAPGQCLSPQENGPLCYRDTQCRSGFCVDNACCAVAACSEGESCGVFGHAGVCSMPPTPTNTPTPTPTPPFPPPLPIQLPLLRVSTVAGVAGGRVVVAVSLSPGDLAVATTANSLGYDPANISIAARTDGTPDCAVDFYGSARFTFKPARCAGAECTGVFAVFPFSPYVDPLPDALPDGVLYRCNVDITASASDGSYPISIDGIVIHDLSNRVVLDGIGIDGQVWVGARPPSIELAGSHPTRPGSRALLQANLHADGVLVAGMQNDVVFDAKVAIAANAEGRPDCVVNPEIDKEATAFTFRPNGCAGAACTAFRALVLSTQNIDPIPDGSPLYWCSVQIADDAAGSYPLTISSVIMSTPDGDKVPGATGLDGVMVVNPVDTPTPVPASTATPTPVPLREMLQAETVVASPGQQVHFSVTLHTLGFPIAGTQNDLTFDTMDTPVAAKMNGWPDCTVNPDIDKGATAFAFRPPGCIGSACTSIRALVLATGNADPIPDGAVLYTCTINVAAKASGRYPLHIGGVIASTPEAFGVPGAAGVDGAIVVAN